jgi:hypothetical protein
MPNLQHLAPIAATLALLLLVQTLARTATRALVSLAGWHAVPWTTGWLGVPVHELSHAAACLLTGRRIHAIRLFAPDPANNTMGSVVWEPGTGPIAWLAALIVGVAPLAGGTVALYGLLRLGAQSAVVPIPSDAALAATSVAQWWQVLVDLAGVATTASLAGWHAGGTTRAATVLFWYLAACIAAHLTPSSADMRGTWRGLLVVAGLAAAAIGIAHQTGTNLAIPLVDALATLAQWVAPGLALAVAPLLLIWFAASILARLVRR